MTKGYRIATDVPWDNPERKPDWGNAYTQPKDAVAELMDRARRHQGDGFKLKERGEKDWGPKREFNELDDRALGRIKDEDFHVGDMLMVWSIKDDLRWLIREVELPTVSMDTIGDDDVDFNHGLIFQDPRFDSVESWGIRNDRFIAGTTIPSAHWARQDSSGQLCEARAEDFGGAPLDVLWGVGRSIAKDGRSGKMLLAGHEWLPQWGEFRFVGTFIGHYDHLHAEGRDITGALC